MYKSPKHLIEDFGGYREVAKRMGMKPTTLHSHMSSGTLPSKWFAAFCGLAGELGRPEPSQELFSFVALPVTALEAVA